MNLISGKVIKSSYYWDEIKDEAKIRLIQALHKEPEAREDADCKEIEKYIRSISVFKPYAEFEYEDIKSVLKDVKLHKFKQGTRICNFGESAESIFLPVNGRVAITHPTGTLMALMDTEGSQKLIKERTQVMTERQVNRQFLYQQKTVTGPGALGGVLTKEQQMEIERNKRLEELKTKNETF